jgi:hypothetical protein
MSGPIFKESINFLREKYETISKNNSNDMISMQEKIAEILTREGQFIRMGKDFNKH